MIIPLDKLLTYKENRYIFTKATMYAIDNIGNINDYSEDDTSWKIVPNILKLALDGKIKIEINNDEDNIEE